MSFKVIVDFEKCTGCESCASVCPAEVYGEVVDGKITVENEEECIGCRACESTCPEEAITIEEE